MPTYIASVEIVEFLDNNNKVVNSVAIKFGKRVFTLHAISDHDFTLFTKSTQCAFDLVEHEDGNTVTFRNGATTAVNVAIHRRKKC